MTALDLLEYGKDVIEEVRNMAWVGDKSSAMNLIRNTPPPKEWLVEYPSLLSSEEKYYTIPIQVLEQAAWLLFGEWKVSKINSPIISHEKGGFAATTLITLKYKTLRSKSDGEGVLYEYLDGVATEYVSSMKLLPLATAKSVASAKKHAFKQLGSFFGGELNRTLEEKPFSYDDIVETVDPETKRLRLLIQKADSLEKVSPYKDKIAIGDKETYELYMKKVKELAIQ